MEIRNNYKIEGRHFKPGIGFMEYLEENAPNERTIFRATGLILYNASLAIGSVVGARLVLENILK